LERALFKPSFSEDPAARSRRSRRDLVNRGKLTATRLERRLKQSSRTISPFFCFQTFQIQAR
jgi:hypothetical protein